MTVPPMPPDAPGTSGDEFDPTLDEPERTVEEIEDGLDDPDETD